MSQKCPRCVRGTVVYIDGPSWWQRRHLRCAHCKGTGLIREELPAEDLREYEREEAE
jgi:hypothetical protein